MKEITFLFGIHNHQPVGNFDRVIEDAYRKAYLPFLETLERHRGIRLAIHNSGVLIDWFEERHPEYLDRLATLTRAGRVEILTGGYYEPILPSVPDQDKIGQIRKLSRKLADRIGRTPRGLWLAERVWEPTLPSPLAEAGVRYLMVDDAHFIAAGAEPEQLWNYWLTEDQGKALAVWPISRALRYLVPFEPAAKTIEFLKGLASAGGGRVALLADDGEKFGVWPDTWEQVYENGWLEEFFTLVEANASWLRMGLPGEEIEARPPAGRIYLPAASYSEMMEWALPAPVQRTFHAVSERLKKSGAVEHRFLSGGFWRNFMARYPESNHLHKRMLDARERLARLDLPDGEKERVLDDIWQSQCNCAYWHGVFGGLYLPHLRDALYRRILSAEERMNRHENPEGRSRAEEGDLDRDGFPEIRLGNGTLSAFISPARGGALTELSFLPALRNFSHGLSRRPEAYHDRLTELAAREEEDAEIAAAVTSQPGEGAPAAPGTVRSIHDRVEMKEPGLEQKLFYDWYRRESLLDHFFRSDTTLDRFERSDYGEQGDFIGHPYEAHVPEDGGAGVKLSRGGLVWADGRDVPVRVEKQVTLADRSSELRIEYRLVSEGAASLPVWFGVEFNFTMLAGDAPDRYYLVNGSKPDLEPRLGGRGSHLDVREVALTDEWDAVAVHLQIDRPCQLWRVPVDTITQSEAGFERIYQSSCVVPHWRITLDPGEPWAVTIRLSVRHRKT